MNIQKNKKENTKNKLVTCMVVIFGLVVIALVPSKVLLDAKANETIEEPPLETTQEIEQKQELIDVLNYDNIKFVVVETLEDEIEEVVQEEYIESEFNTIVIPTPAYNFNLNPATKTRMNGGLITAPDSRQFQLINSGLVYISEEGHYAMNHQGQEFIGVALSYYFGEIGDKFILTMDTGVKMYVYKQDEKSRGELINEVQHPDGSVIEMVISDQQVINHLGYLPDGFNGFPQFSGYPVMIEKIVE